MRKSILPREGLTLEAAFAPVRLTLLQPLLTGALLLAVCHPPQMVMGWPLKVLKRLQSTRALASLSVLFGMGLLRKTNNLLSRLVLNNFTADNTWDWSKEIVVITGGSGGLGAVMVQMFAEKNITIIIFDIAPPKTPISCKSLCVILNLSLMTSE